MKLTYFGHSAFRIQVGETTILLDPYISENPLATEAERIVAQESEVILLTHAHGDHLGDTVEIAGRCNSLVVSNYEISEYLTKKYDLENTLGMNTGGCCDFEWGRLTMTYARHSSSFPDGTYGGNPNGYIIEAGGSTVYAMGDTVPFMEMAWLAEDFKIDAALIPMGDRFTMGARESLRAADLLHAGLYIPIHYNTFPEIKVDIDSWKLMMTQAGHRARIVHPGESLEI